MARYSDEFKEQVVRKMMAPNAKSVAEVHRETGVSMGSLYAWRDAYRGRGVEVAADPNAAQNWSGATKLAVVIETAGMNEQELSEYCRHKGLYPEQIALWRELAQSANDEQGPLTKQQRQQLREQKRRNAQLVKELRRKEAALAEAAALLVLRKKVQSWGEPGDE